MIRQFPPVPDFVKKKLNPQMLGRIPKECDRSKT